MPLRKPIEGPSLIGYNISKQPDMIRDSLWGNAFGR